MAYRLVILDFDGTLADSFGWFAEAFARLAPRHRYRRVDAAELQRLRALGGREILRRVGIPIWRVPLIARAMRREMAREVERIAPFGGVHDALASLAARGTGLALVTSNSRANVERVLGVEATRLFSYVECDVGLFAKRRPLLRVVSRARVACSEAIYAGDELRDLTAARAAGLDFAAVGWGYTTRDALIAHGPTRLLERVDELISLGAAG